jgi:hypothetical protein
MEGEFPEQALALYHKLSLCTFILDALQHLDSQNTPSRIMDLCHEWFERVENDFSTQSDKYYNYKNDSFWKDLAVCSRRAIPVGGAWIVAPALFRMKNLISFNLPDDGKKVSTISVREKSKKNVQMLLVRLGLYKRIMPVIINLTKRRLYYAIHTVDRYLPRFTEQQMNQAYLNISELLKINKNIYGIYRNSWFLDPNLKEISPGLRFLWEVPQQNGAELFCTGGSDQVIKMAIAMSPLRKRLYEEGKYKPMTYAYVWPRKEVLQWAEGVSLSKNIKGHQ